MKVIDSSAKLESPIAYEDMLELIEKAGRVCYKSEDKIQEGSAEKFIRGIIKRGHEAVLEHGNITIRIICDRGVSHELVRHRLASYCQESSRYCNYSQDKFNQELTFIKPVCWRENPTCYSLWRECMQFAENAYLEFINNKKAKPEEARSILPNSLKTEVMMTANVREWRHFLKLRTSKAAHPDMRLIAKKIAILLKTNYPIFFEDIEVEE